MTDLTLDDRRALRLIAGSNIRCGAKHRTMTRLRRLGLAVPHRTGHEPPGDWTWTITPAGQAVLAAMDLAPSKAP